MRAMLAVLLLSIGMPFAAMADGIPIGEDGRFTGGETIVIGLTAAQKSGLVANRTLRLNSEQKRLIRKLHGFAPSELYVYDTRVGENDCTCDAYNRGLWFHEGMVEVPRMYLVTDRQARENEKRREDM